MKPPTKYEIFKRNTEKHNQQNAKDQTSEAPKTCLLSDNELNLFSATRHQSDDSRFNYYGH